MHLTKYLQPRGKHGILQLRVAVPRPYRREHGGPAERIRSLGTSDRRAAEKLARPILAKWEAEWTGAASPSPLARAGNDLDAIAIRWGYELLLDRYERDRLAMKDSSDEEWSAFIDKHRASMDRRARQLATGDYSSIDATVQRIAEREGLPADSIAALRERLAIATRDAMAVESRRRAGELDAEPSSALVTKQLARAADKAKAGETILELFERWASDRLAKGDKREDTITQDRKVIEQFSAFVGPDRDIRSITAIEIADYRDTLRNLPPKWRSHKELAGLDMRAAAAKARELELPQTSFLTVNKHLSTISPLYKWLAQQPAWAGLENRCNGLFHDKVKGRNPRPPFSTATLNKILSSPLFTGFLVDGQEHVPGNVQADDWRKWIPLVCLFTGARLGEIAQLRTGDIRQERGVWFIHICHDEGQGLTTKSGKSRPAAVHRMLERIGFLAFHQRQLERAEGALDASLFPELEPNTRGQISATPSRWWRKYLAAIGVKDGRDGIGAHSFRHTMADRLRAEAELLDDQIEVCLGHNQKTTTSGYGELGQGTVTMFKNWMNAVRFDGVKFGHLIVAEPASKVA